MKQQKPIPNWISRPPLGIHALDGRVCHLEPYEEGRHIADLFKAVAGPGNDEIWRFMPLGPFEEEADFAQALAYTNEKVGWKTMVIKCASTDAVLGMASYMRLRPEHGSAEVGCIAFGDRLKRTTAATEAIYLMIRHAFDDLGYRRFEWKCDNSNDASNAAALRFGFVPEGVFRNDMVIKGRNRNTAWYSITDDEWPVLKHMFERWLAPSNFDETGQQQQKLSAFSGK